MTKHNSYFDGQVQSLGFERNGARSSVGVMNPGTYTFDTAAPERMTVVSGALSAKLPGSSTFQLYPAGTYFEVEGNASFEVRASGPSVYLCEYVG